MSDFPSDVLYKIFLLLPAESLFRFRCVCKEWRSIIDYPSFIRSHANAQHSSTTLLIRTQIGTPIYYLSLDSPNFVNGRQIIDATRAKTLIKRGVPRLPGLPVASCNGLILISSQFDVKKIWVVWNPLNREFHELPRPDVKMFLVACGIGYDCATDDYKVVRIDQAMTTNYFCKTHIYSLKLGRWNRIKNCNYKFSLRYRGGDQGVYLHGTLHWISKDFINALDLRTEEYSQLPLPVISYEINGDVHLDALNGSLIISFFYSPIYFSVWMMEDYGVGESWMKLCSLENLHYIGALWGHQAYSLYKEQRTCYSTT